MCPALWVMQNGGLAASITVCGVTPQAVAEKARVELMITHEPGQMFLTDLPREGGRRS